MCSRSREYAWAGGWLIFRSDPLARRAKAERSGSCGGESGGAGPLRPVPFLAGVEIPWLDGPLVACRPERHGGRGNPDGVCELGGPLLFAPVAKVQGTGGGSLGASFHKVKEEGRPFPACPWFKTLSSRSGNFRPAPRCPGCSPRWRPVPGLPAWAGTVFHCVIWGSRERRSADKRSVGKVLDGEIYTHDALMVNATINNRGEMVLPVKARKAARISPGCVVDVRPEGDGRIVLVRLERAKEPEPMKVKFTRRKGRHTVGSTGRPITSEQVRNLLSEWV